MNLMEDLFSYKAWANKELCELVSRVNTAKYPTQLYAAIRTLNHIYVVERIFKAQLLGETHIYTSTNTKETPSPNQLYASVSVLDDWYLDYASHLPDEQLLEPINFNFVDGDSGCMTRQEILMHIITHGCYHRGEVGRILKQISYTPPKDIFTRFLHDASTEYRLS